MPLEIKTRTVETNGAFNVHKTKKQYALIYQWGYGRIDASSPVEGLATYHLASCSAVILHCAATGRTTVSHSPNFLIMNTFAPMFDWITGGDGTVTPATYYAWLMGRGAATPPEPHNVEAVILRGFEYASPAKAATFGHKKWMDDFHEMCSMMQMRHITVNVTDSQEYVRSGAFLVDKSKARITLLQRQGVLSIRSGGTAIVRLEDPTRKDSGYNAEAQTRDLFAGSLLMNRVPIDGPSLHLQYDVDHYRGPMPLADEGRELIRSKMEGEPPSAQSEIIKRHGTSPDWISGPSNLLRGIFDGYPATGLPCETCPLPGLRTCSACRGAWYCSPEHQKADWKAHKAWCRAHPRK